MRDFQFQKSKRSNFFSFQKSAKPPAPPNKKQPLREKYLSLKKILKSPTKLNFTYFAYFAYFFSY